MIEAKTRENNANSKSEKSDLTETIELVNIRSCKLNGRDKYLAKDRICRKRKNLVLTQDKGSIISECSMLQDKKMTSTSEDKCNKNTFLYNDHFDWRKSNQVYRR